MAKGCGIDLGSSLVRLAAFEASKGKHRFLRYIAAAPEDGEAPAEAARAVLAAPARKLGPIEIGLTGSDLMMRYLPVPPVEDWRLERLMEFEIREVESRSGASLASSYNLLPVPKGLDDEDTMLLSLVREELLESTTAQLGGLGVKAFTPNAIALYNAYLVLGDLEPSTTLIASLGAGTLDLALVHGGDLYFARSVSTSLDKRDATLAARLNIDEARARHLIHQHLDLRLAVGERLSSDAERVTRPLLPLYESLPTLLGGVVTLCKAQARLSELKLDRVLLTGGGARSQGLCEFLQARMQVPVAVWNPAEMVDIEHLPEDDVAQLEADGPGATVALGLGLGAADPDLYALEILTASARKKRDFSQRTIFNLLMGVAAAAFLVVNFFVVSGLADQAGRASRSTLTSKKKLESDHSKAVELLAQVEQEQLLLQDLEARYAGAHGAERLWQYLETTLPDSLWVESFRLSFADGKEWGREDQRVPVFEVAGRAEDDVRAASQAFGAFAGGLGSLLANAERDLQASSKPRGKSLDWSLRLQLMKAAEAVTSEEEGR